MSLIKSINTGDVVRLILLWVIHFFRCLQAFSCFSLQFICRWQGLNFTAAIHIELQVVLCNSYNWHVKCPSLIVLLVPGFPSWLQIKLSTTWMFETVLAEWGWPLPGSRLALPVGSIFCTRSYNVHHFHSLAGNSVIILSTVHPSPFQFAKFWLTVDLQHSVVPYADNVWEWHITTSSYSAKNI